MITLAGTWTLTNGSGTGTGSGSTAIGSVFQGDTFYAEVGGAIVSGPYSVTADADDDEEILFSPVYAGTTSSAVTIRLLPTGTTRLTNVGHSAQITDFNQRYREILDVAGANKLLSLNKTASTDSSGLTFKTANANVGRVGTFADNLVALQQDINNGSMTSMIKAVVSGSSPSQTLGISLAPIVSALTISGALTLSGASTVTAAMTMSVAAGVTPLTINVNSVEIMRVNGTGLGIGGTPAAKLNVRHSTAPGANGIELIRLSTTLDGTTGEGAYIMWTDASTAETGRIRNLCEAGGSYGFSFVVRASGTPTEALRLKADLTANFASSILVAGTKVIGVRDTGWTAMTGTPNEATLYDTSTVTLPQLAGRVMALQTALTTHGLIGA